MAGRLVYFELPADDTQRAEGFLRGALRAGSSAPCKKGSTDHMLAEDADPGGAIYPSQTGEKGAIIYFESDDIDASVERVNELEARPRTSRRSLGPAGTRVARTRRATSSRSSRQTTQCRSRRSCKAARTPTRKDGRNGKCQGRALRDSCGRHDSSPRVLDEDVRRRVPELRRADRVPHVPRTTTSRVAEA